jgi:hypothetical protein
MSHMPGIRSPALSANKYKSGYVKNACLGVIMRELSGLEGGNCSWRRNKKVVMSANDGKEFGESVTNAYEQATGTLI